VLSGQQKTVVRLLFVVFRSLLNTVFARVDVDIQGAFSGYERLLPSSHACATQVVGGFRYQHEQRSRISTVIVSTGVD